MRINLLLADDHQIIKDGIKLMLANYDNINIIYEASNGNEVVEYVKVNSNNVDVVLMDINMPELDGVETTKIISKNHKNIKVLALTMHADIIYIVKMIEAGASGYVLKEINFEELGVAIKTIANGGTYFCKEVYKTLRKWKANKEGMEPLTLTPREMDVLTFISKGLTNKEIGEKLFISSRTVEFHRKNLIKKLDVKNTAELIRYITEKNFI